MTPNGHGWIGGAAVPRTDAELDRAMLARTIELAELGRPGARPNPVVGAVLAMPDGTIIGSGHHVRRGEAHAERALLEDLGDAGQVPEEVTLYVSLEPCSHHGRTPPCTDIIIERGVQRVVYASTDANPVTAGRGPTLMTQAGIEVLRGPADIERRALQQNAGFHSVHLRGRPYVTAKFAMTPSGRFATGDPARRWISGKQSREHVHYLRAGSGAVACGVGTVLADDPQLTVRGVVADRVAVPPVRIVYDRSLRTPIDSQLVRTVEDAPLLLVCAHDADADRQLAFEACGVEVWRAPECEPGTPCIPGASLAMLAERGINEVLLEAGPTLLDAFTQSDLVDQVIAFVGDVAAPDTEPGLALEHPLVAAALAAPGEPSGEDTMYAAAINPVWEFPGATPD